MLPATPCSPDRRTPPISKARHASLLATNRKHARNRKPQVRPKANSAKVRACSFSRRRNAFPQTQNTATKTFSKSLKLRAPPQPLQHHLHHHTLPVVRRRHMRKNQNLPLLQSAPPYHKHLRLALSNLPTFPLSNRPPRRTPPHLHNLVAAATLPTFTPCYLQTFPLFLLPTVPPFTAASGCSPPFVHLASFCSKTPRLRVSPSV